MSASKRPQDNAFQQQRLKAWQPLLTPKWVIGTFGFVAVLFIPIGLTIVNSSNKVWETEYRYDDLPSVGAPNPDDLCTSNCSVTFEINITEIVEPPIFVYYKLTNFYQNHRRYVKSRSDDQLQGILNTDISSTCDPLSQWDGKDLYPCGLIAQSMFNDTFAATFIAEDGSSTAMEGANWDSSNIAWASDADKFIQPTDIDVWCDGTQITCIGPGGFIDDVTDPHFMVWMRTAGLPTFKKLYAKIANQQLNPGDKLEITVENTFPVRGFDGTKSIVLSTTSWLGGKNSFLGYAYIIVGAVCLLLCGAFLLKEFLSPRPLGDMRYFNWPGSKTEGRQES